MIQRKQSRSLSLILSRNLPCHMRAPCPMQTENADRVLTHVLTHEQKKRGGNNGEKHICG